MTTRRQHNGLLLLHAYLERIYVYDNALAKMGATPSSDEDWAAFLQEVGEALKATEDDREGFEPDGARFGDIVERLRVGMRARRGVPGAPLVEQLAAVAGDLFGAKHRNDNMIYWGDIYDADVADRLRQQIPYHWSTTRRIESCIAQTIAGTPLEEQDSAQLEQWFTSVCALTENVDDDLKQIKLLLTS